MCARLGGWTCCNGWTTSTSNWAAPSVLVFTPGLIHAITTASGASKWLDVFSPTRLAISKKPGWVRNKDEYPLP